MLLHPILLHPITPTGSLGVIGNEGPAEKALHCSKRALHYLKSAQLSESVLYSHGVYNNIGLYEILIIEAGSKIRGQAACWHICMEEWTKGPYEKALNCYKRAV